MYTGLMPGLLLHNGHFGAGFVLQHPHFENIKPFRRPKTRVGKKLKWKEIYRQIGSYRSWNKVWTSNTCRSTLLSLLVR